MVSAPMAGTEVTESREMYPSAALMKDESKTATTTTTLLRNLYPGLDMSTTTQWN